MAAVAGALCGTVLAYLANDYFGEAREPENLQMADAATGAIARKAPAIPPEEIGEATAAEAPGEDDDLSQTDDPEAAEQSEPLPLPVSAAKVASIPDQPEADPEVPKQVPEPTAASDSLDRDSEDSAAPAESDEAAEADEPPAIAALDKAEQTAPSRPALVPPTVESFRDCDLCPVMVKIPIARFSMGSPEDEEGRQTYEGPQRVVTFAKPFAIGQHEITIANWEACVGDGGCKRRIDDQGWGGGNRPAINISWEEITGQYLPWLSKKTGHEYRLPSEAEWEYAARAGGDGEKAGRFSFGDSEKELCGFANGSDLTAIEQNGGGSGVDCRDGYAATAPAGSFSPNRFGLFDMHGNVWEWVEDCWNESYDKAPTDGSAWKEGDCSNRVVRGGSWNSDAAKLRSAARGWNQPSGRNRSIGFRVLREL
jgi:formylglycine-generating enzyme required for sulfatase activity